MRAVRPLLLLTLLVSGFFAPALVGGRALVPVHHQGLSPWRAEAPADRLAAIDADAAPLSSDKTLMFHPQLAVCGRRLLAGETPAWNPHNLCGVPLLAQAVHGALHPPNWLAFVLPPARAYGLVAALQVLMAAAFCALLARELGATTLPAVLAGVAFGFCGFLSARVHWYQIQGASVYLPAVLLGAERLATGRGRWGALAGAGAALGASFLAGFPQSSLLIGYAAGAWGLARSIAVDAAAGDTLGRASRVGAALALGVALGLPQLLPAAAFARSGESTRASVAPEVVRTLGMKPASLATIVRPELFGHPDDVAGHEHPVLRSAGAVSRLVQKPHANWVETNGFVGAIVVALALMGLLRRGPGRALGGGLTLAGGALALDSPLLLGALRLPGLDTADPRRFLLLACLGLALLAARGLQLLLDGRRPAAGAWALGLAAFAALVPAAALLRASPDAWAAAVAPALARALGVGTPEVLAHAADLDLDRTLLAAALLRLAAVLALGAAAWIVALRRPRLGAALLVLVAAADQVETARRSRTLLPVEGAFAAPPGLDRLAGDGAGRLARFHPAGPDVLGQPLPPNTGLPFGVRDSSGYITLAPRRVEALHELLAPGSTHGVGTEPLADEAALSSPLLDAFAVDRVLSSVPLEVAGLAPLGTVGDLWLYRNEDARPRAYLAPGVVRVADEDAARALLADPGFDPARRTVIVEPSGASGGSSGGDVTLVRDEPERVDLHVTADGPGWLVLVDSDLPGWTATVDGEPEEIRAANLAFRAVPVPAGASRVAFDYTPPGWRAGLLGGAVGLLGLLLAGAAALRRARTG